MARPRSWLTRQIINYANCPFCSELKGKPCRTKRGAACPPHKDRADLYRMRNRFRQRSSTLVSPYYQGC